MKNGWKLKCKIWDTALVTQRKSRPSIIQSWEPNSRWQHQYTLSNLGMTKPAATKQVLEYTTGLKVKQLRRTTNRNSKHKTLVIFILTLDAFSVCIVSSATPKQNKTLLESVRVRWSFKYRLQQTQLHYSSERSQSPPFTQCISKAFFLGWLVYVFKMPAAATDWGSALNYLASED